MGYLDYSKLMLAKMAKAEARETWERHIESPDQALPTGRTSRDRYIVTGDKLGPST
ncbi:hypothetical protein ACT3TC_12270 [Halomonas sp. AOP27-A1-41]|uniref:hypothetical protein n=1 Tax=Halomonas sp. AOP27-A1-41 TaxID=3457707 RepID=UPI00403472F2